MIAGVGGMTLNFGPVVVTEVACALILGILTNLLVNIKGKKKEDKGEQITIDEAVSKENALPAAEENTEGNK